MANLDDGRECIEKEIQLVRGNRRVWFYADEATGRNRDTSESAHHGKPKDAAGRMRGKTFGRDDGKCHVMQKGSSQPQVLRDADPNLVPLTRGTVGPGGFGEYGKTDPNRFGFGDDGIVCTGVEDPVRVISIYAYRDEPLVSPPRFDGNVRTDLDALNGGGAQDFAKSPIILNVSAIGIVSGHQLKRSCKFRGCIGVARATDECVGKLLMRSALDFSARMGVENPAQLLDRRGIATKSGGSDCAIKESSGVSGSPFESSANIEEAPGFRQFMQRRQIGSRHEQATHQTESNSDHVF